MGSRLLRHTLHHPLRDRSIPAARHGAVEALLDDYGRLAGEARKALRGIADIERIAGRIALRNARPRTSNCKVPTVPTIYESIPAPARWNSWIAPSCVSCSIPFTNCLRFMVSLAWTRANFWREHDAKLSQQATQLVTLSGSGFHESLSCTV